MGIYIIENPKYDIKPAIAPVIILSFIEDSERQSYFIKIQITSGAIKHIKNMKENIPMYGINVTVPSINPKKILNIEICLSKVRLIFIDYIIQQLNAYDK